MARDASRGVIMRKSEVKMDDIIMKGHCLAAGAGGDLSLCLVE